MWPVIGVVSMKNVRRRGGPANLALEQLRDSRARHHGGFPLDNGVLSKRRLEVPVATVGPTKTPNARDAQ